MVRVADDLVFVLFSLRLIWSPTILCTGSSASAFETAAAEAVEIGDLWR